MLNFDVFEGATSLEPRPIARLAWKVARAYCEAEPGEDVSDTISRLDRHGGPTDPEQAAAMLMLLEAAAEVAARSDGAADAQEMAQRFRERMADRVMESGHR